MPHESTPGRVATLYIFAGLPGSGKSTLARLLARQVGAAHVRIDTIEQALRERGVIDVHEDGYRVAYRVAADILAGGVSVIADSCNPIEVTRRAWERVADDVGAPYVNIEVVCSDARVHRERVETRSPTVPGLRLPTWSDVVGRTYETWTGERVVVDTSRGTAEQCLEGILSSLPDPTA